LIQDFGLGSDPRSNPGEIRGAQSYRTIQFLKEQVFFTNVKYWRENLLGQTPQ